MLEDDLSTRANFRHVFGGQLPEAAALLFDDVSLWIEPPPPEIDVAAKPADCGRIVTFRLVGGRVQPSRPKVARERLTSVQALDSRGSLPIIGHTCP